MGKEKRKKVKKLKKEKGRRKILSYPSAETIIVGI